MPGGVAEEFISYIFSSDPKRNQNQEPYDNGSSFDVDLGNTLQLPPDAAAASLEVSQANVWWTVPNISSDLNNDQFRIIENGNPHTIVIPKGLYDLTGFSAAVSLGLNGLGLSPDLITFLENTSTNKVVAVFNAANVQMDFTGANTPREILGWDARLVPLAPSILGQTELADNIARFNTVNSFLLHSSIVKNGIPINDRQSNVIASIPIDVQPGSQITYQPRTPVRIRAPDLIYGGTSNFNVWLTDQNGNKVDTNGEYYSFVIIIRYFMPF